MQGRCEGLYLLCNLSNSFSKDVNIIILLSSTIHSYPFWVSKHRLMKKIIFHCTTFFIFILGSFLACKKDPPTPPTIITGTVTNKTTGEPVAGAYIDCSIRKDDEYSDPYQDHSTYSDFDGIYRLEIPYGYSHDFSNVYQIGFLPFVDPQRSIEIREAETNIVDVALIPTDGFIRLIMHNDLPTNDALYVNFFSPTRALQPYIGGALIPLNLPFVLPTAGIREELFALPSEEFVTIHWGTAPYTPSTNSPFRDSIYLSRNDTVAFNIHF